MALMDTPTHPNAGETLQRGLDTVAVNDFAIYSTAASTINSTFSSARASFASPQARVGA
jgi:hypothetical protein